MSEEKGDQEGENQLTDQSVKEEAITLLGGGGGKPKGPQRNYGEEVRKW